MFRFLLLCVVLSRCSAQGRPPLAMSLNSAPLANQSRVVLTAGSAFSLGCHGDGAVRWSSSAFRLQYEDLLANPLAVWRSHPRHTGTYRCRFANRSLDAPHVWTHLYVTDPADPSSVFVTPNSIPRAVEGRDFLLRCLLTDPSLANCSLRLLGDAGRHGTGLPRGMNATFDPMGGVLIRKLQASFNGRYVCTGWRDGRLLSSMPVQLLVTQRLLSPPSASIGQPSFTRLEGEEFQVTCVTSNPSHLYNVTWAHPLVTPPTLKTVEVRVERRYSNGRLYLNSTLSVSSVAREHAGTYACTALSEAGVATATSRLTVVDKPYLRIFLRLDEDAAGTGDADVRLVANVSTQVRTNVSGVSRVEVHQGREVTLAFVMEAYPPISRQRWQVAAPNRSSGGGTAAYRLGHAVAPCRSEAKLLLHRVGPEDRGRYSLHFASSFFSGTQEVDLRVYRPPSVVLRREDGVLLCGASGYPLPTMHCYICPGVTDRCGDNATQLPAASAGRGGDETAWRRLSVPPDAADDVTVECVAASRLGRARDTLVVHKPRRVFTSALIGAMASAAFLFLLLLVVLYKWRQTPRYEIRWKIIESTDGNSYTFVDPSQLPYNQKWEFPRDKLRLGAVLGSGAFGKVVEATAYGLGHDHHVTTVAVKMLKPSAHSEEREALMSELKILSHLGYHDNIVNLLGACTQGGPMLMITEYCSHGDLLNFLRAHAQDFLTSILSLEKAEGQAFYKNTAAQHGRLRSDSGISCCSDDQDAQAQRFGVPTDGLCVGDLMMFSSQVAQGLDFLSSKNCIHRDVAARNILLTDRCVAKICDFGLARDIRNDDSYIVQGNARLPVKWMAPESIFQCVYTVQSDVWSYGVLLWEIFSLGKSPYPNVAVDTNFYKMIMDGRHMDPPAYAPAEMYQLMIDCWSLEPTARPTFRTIGQLIGRLLPPTNEAWPLHGERVAYRNIREEAEEDEEEDGEEEEELSSGVKSLVGRQHVCQ